MPLHRPTPMAAKKSKQKQPPAPSIPERKEVPSLGRLLGVVDTPDAKHPKWRLSLLDLDHDGSWSWAVDGNALLRIVAFLVQMEKLTWTEIRAQTGGSGHRMHHAQPVETLCTEAQNRLKALKLDDFDEMFRFRLGGPLRLWGILHGDVFYPVWWDAEHQVYPTERN